ncbi:YSIRK-type signal peptide-containing protein [Staphylococcus aureus]|uniref:YSIRK-type signal peptide-containing protein n=1 Tax=Staphylococcus aureus TaxID=1280 RepID=UPI002115D155
MQETNKVESAPEAKATENVQETNKVESAPEAKATESVQETNKVESAPEAKATESVQETNKVESAPEAKATRKFTIGTASILVGSTLIFGIGSGEAKADEKVYTNNERE